MATAWYTAHIFPLPANCVRQINTAITWYLWRGDIFRVPLSTLQLPKQKGGWGLINIAAKCKALYFYRLRAISQGGSEFTALWLRKWDPKKQEGNPPYTEDNITVGIDTHICTGLGLHILTRSIRIRGSIQTQNILVQRVVVLRRVYCELLSKCRE